MKVTVTVTRDPELKNMPILMLTGVKDQTGIDFKSAADAPTCGPVDGFLEKPVEPTVLLAAIEKLLAENTQGGPGI